MARLFPTVLPTLLCLFAFPPAAFAEPQGPALPGTVELPEARPGRKAEEMRPDPESGTGPAQGLPAEMPAPGAKPPQPMPGPSGDTQETGGNERPNAPRQSVGRHNARNFTRGPGGAEQRAEAACQQRLQRLGVVFEKQAPLSEPDGCRLAVPLSVTSLGAGISLEPAGVMSCPMAEAAAEFAQKVISPAARSVYGAELQAIANASAYVCRPRNGTTKLSEHAYGNALDMSRFVLGNGTAIEVAATSEPKASDFLARIRKAACGPFKTVLGPGSDADHATHFHVDLARRRNGATFCQ